MPLASGTQLGPYRVIAPIGQGGMGEVFRARDTRLGRDVAIKVLPADASADADRLRRFELEARAASALNHPNVLVVHDTGMCAGAPYVVSELLEGASLRAHLGGTPVPVPRAVAWAVEIAQGLAAAHDRAIVHRDVKPENVFITREGRVKILDFGIATIVRDGAVRQDETTGWHATEPGVVLGTVGYMSPEQVKGERADARSDIFALGVVLFEMLAGRQPFARDSKIETLSALLTDAPPDLTALRREVPPALERVVRHCLEKDPTRRFQSARDVAFALESLVDAAAPHAAAIHPERRLWQRGWFRDLAVAGLALVAGALVGAMLDRRAEPEPNAGRFEIPAPANGNLQGILGVSSAVSPDGRSIVMVVTTDTGTRLFVRPLASTEARLLPGTEHALGPFWSPDSRSIGFFTRHNNKLQRIGVNGGTPQTICDLISTDVWSAGAWAPDDTILITGVRATIESNPAGVFAVPAGGGAPRILAPADSPDSYLWPSFLPDGRNYLLYSAGKIHLGSLDAGGMRALMPAWSRAQYAEPGYLLFVRDGALMAQPFDLRTLSLSGAPRVVANDLLYFRALGWADFSASRTGVLTYQAGATLSRLVWYGRDGVEVGHVGAPDDYYFLRLSPDGRQVAVDVMDRRAGTTDIRLVDLARDGQLSAITSDQSIEWTPVFSPDARQLAFASARRGPPHVIVKRITDPDRGTELVAPSAAVQFVTDWADTPDGELIVYHDSTPATGMDVMGVSPASHGTPRVLVQTPGTDMDGRLSPDGRWLAYASNESGRTEVYVRSLSGTTARWQVSSGGGLSPRWRGSGAELYYLAANSAVPFGPPVVDGKLMAVQVTADGGELRVGVPQPLFSVRARLGQYETTSDGARFLVNAGSGTAALPITVWLNWTESFER